MKRYKLFCAVLGCLAMPVVSSAVCLQSNSTLQQQCEQRELQQQQAQQRAQQEAQERAQQQAQQRAQQEAQQRAQQEEQQRAQQEAQQRSQQEAQQRAQQEAQQRSQQEAQQRAQQQAQQRSAQQRSQQQAQQRAQPEQHQGVSTRPGQAGSGQAGPQGGASGGVAAGRSAPHVQAGSIQQINAQRAVMHGVNHSPLPPGRVLTDTHGRSSLATADGRRYVLRSNGTVAEYRGQGRSANFYPDGRVRSVHTAAVDVVRTGRGARMVVVRRPDHTLLVSFGPHAGYVQREVLFHGHSYLQRSYLIAGHLVVRNYLAYTYGGFTYYGYVPAYAFAPAYYSWLVTPWGVPVAYPWGWANAAWYGYYGGYLVPYTTYVSPAAWMTDYYLATVLQTAYAAQYAPQPGSQPPPPPLADSPVGDGGDAADEVYASAPAPITPALKAQITRDVQSQVAGEAAAAQGGGAAVGSELPAVLQPNHVFVVDQPLNAVTDQEQGCSLSAGDVLKLITPPSAGIPTAQLQVAASHEADCPRMAEVTLTFDDLQEMYNSFRAQVDAAAQALGARNAGSPLPQPPPGQAVTVPGPAGDSADTVALLASAQDQGNQAEASVSTAAFSQ